VRRAEATAEQLFPDKGERQEYEKRVMVVDSMQKDIEGVEWYLFQAEQMTRGKLQLLNDQGRWEPFKKDGLRGWLLILVRAHTVARYAPSAPLCAHSLVSFFAVVGSVELSRRAGVCVLAYECCRRSCSHQCCCCGSRLST
jgi:hypothetical protein